MPEIQCSRCGKTAEMMTENLFLGKMEQEIKEHVCQDCWNEWNRPGGVKTMVINEYHLNLGDESARNTLKQQMRAFFKLPDASVEFKDYRT
ncbi:MAG: Fe-S cluster protector protein [Nitrospirae bacterium]|nr:MAG: Fe-S cluster protector protein [Nitrospirota bacterium]